LYNEIFIIFGALREILEAGCDAIELLTFDVVEAVPTSAAAPQQPPDQVVAGEGDNSAATRGGRDDNTGAVVTHAGSSGLEEITRKALLQLICFRLDLEDNRFWNSDSAMYYMVIQSLRLCYAMATDVDEQFVFAGGRIVLTLDRVLIVLLDCSLQMPECLFGLANQMFMHHTPWVFLRGRLTNAYDLLAMIPSATEHADDSEPPQQVTDVIDTRPRGRMHVECLTRSRPKSNLMDSTRWVRVVVASMLVLTGGIMIARKANQMPL
jgi:hypothetical protein